MSSEETYTSLATTYAESLAMVEALAETSLVKVYTSLLPPIFSKQDIITCLQKYKKMSDRLDKKLACLTLLTDYVVAAIANPFLVDIFQQDTTNRSKKYMMDIVSLGWVSLFQAIQNSLPMNKPSKEAMQATLSFLRRMDHLLLPFDLRLSSLRITSASDPCFWSCGLQAIDGREAPVTFVSRMEKKFVRGFPQDSELEDIFGSTDDDISSSTKQGEKVVSTSPSPRISVSMALVVKRLHVANLQLKSGVEQVVDCQVVGGGVVLIITTRGGNCAKVVLGVKEMSAIVLSLKGDEMLFLFLTVAGCLAVQNSFSRLPGMSVPPMALLGGENRRLVVFAKKMGQEEGDRLTDALRVVMGEKFALAGQSYGKRLLAKTVEHGKLFSVVGEKKGGEEAVARYGDRVQGVVGRREEDRLSMVNRYSRAEDRETGRTFNYWADPSLLLSQNTSINQISSFTIQSSQMSSFSSTLLSSQMSSSSPTLLSSQMSSSSPTLLSSQMSSSSPPIAMQIISPLHSICSSSNLQASHNLSPISNICYPSTLEASQISSPTLPASQLSSPLPTRHPPAACHCSPSTQPACSICRPAKAVSQPAVGRGALQALDIPVIFADNKEEFLQLNATNVQSKLPRQEALQAKYLDMKWIELTNANRKRKAEDGDESEVLKPRVNVIKSLANPPKESNGLVSPNIQTPDPASTPTNTFALSKSTIPDIKFNRNSSLMPSIATVLSGQSTSPTGKCECDDCLYVTKSHMERTRVTLTKCKCHPCVLRGKQMAERIAKPWELVTLAAYEGENYWLEPWIEDLFRDINQKKVTVKKAAMMTGTTYGQVYRQYKEGLARLTM